MTRLTIASLTSELAAQDILMQKEGRGYRVTLSNGFNFWESKLTSVVERLTIELDIQKRANILVEQLSNVQTEPTPSEIMNTQNTRVNQLAEFYQSTNSEDLDWLPEDISPREQEEEIAAQLIREAAQRREQRRIDDVDYELIDMHMQMENDRKDAAKTIDLLAKHKGEQDHHRTARGFDRNHRYITRVSKQLQKRSNAFNYLLNEAQTPNTRRNPMGMRVKVA